MEILSKILSFTLRLYALADDPQLALKVFDTDGTLAAICLRESQCDNSRVFHPTDYGNGKTAFVASMDVGSLSSACMWHSYRTGYEWSTRGLHGQIAAYAIPYVGCWPPEILNVAIIDTYIAAQRLKVAKSHRATKALKQWAGLI